MREDEYAKMIVEAVRPINREYYSDKVKYWLVKSDVVVDDEKADRLVSQIFDGKTPENKNICKGRLACGKRCVKPAKDNGYCGYHKKQYKPPVGNQVNGNRVVRPKNIPTLL